jgi:hypothetical protein
MIGVLSLLQSEPFVQSVQVATDKVPTIILYNERQIQDIRNYCFNRQDGSVFSCDKTFNLSSLFLTVTTYQNKGLKWANDDKEEPTYPVFFGPLFLHGNSDTASYNVFFSHLAGLLMDSPNQQLRFGSDDERAMRKSIMHCFPSASILSCTRHLKVYRYFISYIIIL